MMNVLFRIKFLKANSFLQSGSKAAYGNQFSLSSTSRKYGVIKLALLENYSAHLSQVCVVILSFRFLVFTFLKYIL